MESGRVQEGAVSVASEGFYSLGGFLIYNITYKYY
jgi:hypothetical protein